MAIARTAKGTNSSKAATASLSVNNVTIDAGKTILVGVVFFASANNPTIKWGNKKLRRDKTNEHSAGHHTQIYRARTKNTRTLDVVCTWGTSTPGARAMFVTQIEEASGEDISVVNDNNNSTSPNTSSAGTSNFADTISIACFGSNGPLEDTAATGTTQGHTLGQRDGTTGGADTTNVTIQETFEILSATGVIRGGLTGVTSRDWANLIVAYKSDTYTVTDAYRNLWVTDTDADAVNIVVDPGGGRDSFIIRIDLPVFEAITDAEIADAIRAGCVWHADHVSDVDNSVEPTPAAEQTRIDALVNDTFKV